MNIRTRLASLERQLGMNGAGCPTCGDRGLPAMVLEHRCETTRSGGCPLCGAVSVIHRIILDDGEGEGQPDEHPGARA